MYCVRNANNRAKLHETFTVKIEIYPPIAMATLIVYFERSLLTTSLAPIRFRWAFIAETSIYPPLETIDLFAEKSKRYLRESVGH